MSNGDGQTIPCRKRWSDSKIVQFTQWSDPSAYKNWNWASTATANCTYHLLNVMCLQNMKRNNGNWVIKMINYLKKTITKLFTGNVQKCVSILLKDFLKTETVVSINQSIIRLHLLWWKDGPSCCSLLQIHTVLNSVHVFIHCQQAYPSFLQQDIKKPNKLALSQNASSIRAWNSIILKIQTVITMFALLQTYNNHCNVYSWVQVFQIDNDMLSMIKCYKHFM